jgi:predicted membrane channel-forming protein YqfA (hemolysin III family)
MKVVVWLAAIAVGLVLYETVGHWFYHKAAERVCSHYATEKGWALIEWDAAPFKRAGLWAGGCVFVAGRSGERFRVSQRRMGRDAIYHFLVVTGSAISVTGIALTLVIGNSLTGALD